MAFLGGLFKRKPGGTLIGNLFRGVAQQVTGGILGTGVGMITQLDADKRDLNDYDFYNKYGQNKNGTVNPATAPIVPIGTYVGDQSENQLSNSNNFMESIKSFFKTVPGKVVSVVLVFGILVIIYKKFGKKGRGGIL